MELDIGSTAGVASPEHRPVEVLLGPDEPRDEGSKVLAFLAGGAVIAGAMFAFLYLGQWDRDDGLTTGSIGRIEAPDGPHPPTLRLPFRS